MKQTPEGLARQILKDGGITMPVDVSAVAQSQNIEVVERELEEEVSGVLIVKGDQGVIGVNRLHHRNRQRFTIAHEIGHFLLHRQSSKVFIDAMPVFFRDSASSEGIDKQEVEANAFAAELLMPQDVILQALKGREIDAFDDIAMRKLASQFGVSVQALTIRLTRLSLINLDYKE